MTRVLRFRHFDLALLRFEATLSNLELDWVLDSYMDTSDTWAQFLVKKEASGDLDVNLVQSRYRHLILVDCILRQSS